MELELRAEGWTRLTATKEQVLMPERIGQPQDQPTPHTSRACQLCATLRHPAQAAQGRALTAHLAQHPFPAQAQ